MRICGIRIPGFAVGGMKATNLRIQSDESCCPDLEALQLAQAIDAKYDLTERAAADEICLVAVATLNEVPNVRGGIRSQAEGSHVGRAGVHHVKKYHE